MGHYDPMGADLGYPDEYMGDGLSNSLLAGWLGGSYNPHELSMYGPHGYGGYGRMGYGHGLGYHHHGLGYPHHSGWYRSAYDQWFPDRTLFIVIMCVLGGVALLLIAALVALVMYSRKNSGKKYYVEA